MSYFPVAENRSGQILASGIMGAADAQAKMYDNLGENIGGALSDLGKAYGTYIEDRIDDMGALKVVKGLADSGYKPFGDIYKNLMGLGPRAAGRAARAVVGDAGGWISQVMIAGMNQGTRRKQMGLQSQLPIIRAEVGNAQEIATTGPAIGGATRRIK